MLCGTDIINREKSVDHILRTGVTPQLSTVYLLLRSRNFIFGGSVVTSTIPADLLELKARFVTRLRSSAESCAGSGNSVSQRRDFSIEDDCIVGIRPINQALLDR